jgi:hypothetical protein
MNQLVRRDHEMAQAVSHRPLTKEALVLVRVNQCGISGGQSSIGTGFSLSSSVFCQYYFKVALHLGNEK